MVKFCLLALSRFPLRKSENAVSVFFFSRIEFTTSALLIVGVRGYLLDQSGDGDYRLVRDFSSQKKKNVQQVENK